MVKATLNYRNFISKIKKGGVRPGYVPEDVLERWMDLWGSAEYIRKSEINLQNRRGGRVTSVGTHNGGYISIGEHLKKLCCFTVALASRSHSLMNLALVGVRSLSQTPSPLKFSCLAPSSIENFPSLVASSIYVFQVTIKIYEEILREKVTSQTDIDQCEAYYQAVGGEKKRRIYGLGAQAKNYYEQNLCGSSSLPPPFSQSTSITDMNEFVKQMMAALTSHLVPIIVEHVQASITPSANPLIVTIKVSPATNVNEVDTIISGDDRIP
ncbi:uncharacterized protein LOC114076118 [Solanum pennellii]|uniref:Uncharacterized protein LOC114076118 n=1 Tax=Solanum pennellii TaxID=28526 RepID=A0ABM1V447_SOLPN|nr:uncharacterized protein LOC114076118 [Solanum pennellii]